jgi:hypothetical protein
MTLEQRTGLFARQRFSLLEDKLLVRTQALGRATEYAISFSEIATNPVRVRQTAWNWFLAAGIPLTIAAFFVVVALAPRSYQANGFLPAATFFTIVAAALIYGGIRRTVNVIVFSSSAGRVVIRHGRPNQDTCKEFVQALQHHAEDSRNIQTKITRGLLQTLRREEFLGEWEYRKACELFGLSEDTSSSRN